MDGITKFSLPAEKLLNAIYWTWQKRGFGNEIMTLPIHDLMSLIDFNSNDDEYFYECLDELSVSQKWRNFQHKGREVKYHSGSFLSFTIWKDNRNYIDVSINPIIISALKERAGFTPLEIEQANRFRTKYGYKLWQMYKRYKTLPNHHDSKLGNITKTLDEVNAYFNMSYKTLSEAERPLKRAINEVKKITGEEIFLTKVKNLKSFSFSWEKEAHYLSSERAFINYMRKNFVNRTVIETNDKHNGNQLIISISEDGKIYDKLGKDFTAKRSKEMWSSLYKLAKDGNLKIIEKTSV